jgi:hypothetical protein
MSFRKMKEVEMKNLRMVQISGQGGFASPAFHPKAQ